jgi:phage terminase Nu1 subunit (DNA packaging protein)
MLKKELAEALGISGAMVSKLSKRGMPTDSVERAMRWRRRHLEPGRIKSIPRNPPPDDGQVTGDVAADKRHDEDRDAARTRREIAEANMAEMDEARRRCELISVQAVQDQMALDYATTRDGLLQIPARMGATLAAESEPAAVQRLLHAEIHQVLQRLAGAADSLPLIDGAFA